MPSAAKTFNCRTSWKDKRSIHTIPKLHFDLLQDLEWEASYSTNSIFTKNKKRSKSTDLEQRASLPDHSLESGTRSEVASPEGVIGRGVAGEGLQIKVR